MNEEMVAILATFLVVFVPVVGITARIALKPFNETILVFLKNKHEDRMARVTEQRLALLEQELMALRADVSHVNEQKEFYQRLAEGGTRPPDQIGS